MFIVRLVCDRALHEARLTERGRWVVHDCPCGQRVHPSDDVLELDGEVVSLPTLRSAVRILIADDRASGEPTALVPDPEPVAKTKPRRKSRGRRRVEPPSARGALGSVLGGSSAGSAGSSPWSGQQSGFPPAVVPEPRLVDGGTPPPQRSRPVRVSWSDIETVTGAQAARYVSPRGWTTKAMTSRLSAKKSGRTGKPGVG